MVAGAVLTGMLPAGAWGLAPADIVVLFNSKSPNSLRISRYYMKARNIPADHLVGVPCDSPEGISEAAYRDAFAPAVRRGLADAGLHPTCLVTTYGMPLKIYGKVPSPAEHTELAGYQRQLDALLATLENEITAYDRIAPAAPPPASAPTTGPAATGLQSVIARINTAARAAGIRVEKVPENQRAPFLTEFMKVQERVAGPAGLITSLQVPDHAPNADAARQRLAALAARVHNLEQQYQQLAGKRDDPQVRRQLVAVRLQGQGELGEALAITQEIAYLKPENTEACLDSELALLLAGQPYPLSNWLPNPRNIELYPTIQHMNSIPRTLLVCRLDGLDVNHVERMIDTTIAVEKKGLEGKLYLDARGLHGTDPYSAYDADLRRAAEWLKEHSTIEVVLDDNPELLQAKNAPDAALYLGWYSLRNYQPTAQWVQGAVGFHLASNEMFTLHDPDERGWVPNLLNRGFCGTLGPTDEPYLTSFPKASQFFPLLLSGEFTQGEVFEVTNPMLSWRIGFVGDPLYNPYKVKPRVKIDDLKADIVLRNAFAILRPAP
jgi:uncharacterized protein (TIGR03790 family)